VDYGDEHHAMGAMRRTGDGGLTVSVRWLKYSTAVAAGTLLIILSFARPTLAFPVVAIFVVGIVASLPLRRVSQRPERDPQRSDAKPAVSGAGYFEPSRRRLAAVAIIAVIGGLCLCLLLIWRFITDLALPTADSVARSASVTGTPRLYPPTPPSPPIVTAQYGVRANLKDDSWEIVDTVALNNESIIYVADRWTQLKKQVWGETVQWSLEVSPEGRDIELELEAKFPGIWRNMDDPTTQRTISTELKQTDAGLMILESVDKRLEQISCLGIAPGSLVNDVTHEFESQDWTKVSDVPLTFSHRRVAKAEMPRGFTGTTEDIIHLLRPPTSSCLRISISEAESRLEIVTPPYVLEGTEPPTDPINDTRWLVGLDAEDALQEGVQVRVLHPLLRNYPGVHIARLTWAGLFAFVFSSGTAFLLEEILFGRVLRRLPESIRGRVPFYRSIGRRLKNR
jgi:hypothetical protein